MLILAAAPIGNPLDASTRLQSMITEVSFIAAEDSRRFLRLCKELGITPHAKVISYFEGNELSRLDEITSHLIEGTDVLVITDAGMPAVSDPGYRLIRIALDHQIPISVLPGPSAVNTALLLSGLPTDRYLFDGFPPRTSEARRKWLEKLVHEERTVVFFEAPHRIHETIKDAVDILGGEREAALCREMTKHYEEIIRAPLSELLAKIEERDILGEVTMVLAGISEIHHEPEDLIAAVLARESLGISRKDAIVDIAREMKVPKRELFDLMVSYKKNHER